MLEIIVVCLAIMLVSLVGVLTLSKNATIFVEKNLGVLTSFAAGIFAAVAIFLLLEFVEHGSLLAALLWATIGALFIVGTSQLLPEFHHHHTRGSGDPAHSRRSGLRILMSDGVHNIADGILIAASFLAGGTVGWGVALSILIHEFVQEITEFFVLKRAGFSSRRALELNFLVSSTILIGAVGAYFFLETFENIEAPLLGFAAGGFIAVLLQDLLPMSLRSAKQSGKVAINLVALVIGLAVMALVTATGSH